IFSSLKVRPTGATLSTGDMTYSGAGIAGIINGSTNFGTLSTVAGAVTQLAFTTQPGDAVYGSNLSPQPVVETQDQFGNASTDGLGANNDVALTLTGAGTLLGTATLDIGTSAENGIVSFSGLTVDAIGTDNYLTASATGLIDDDSDLFDITAKPINVTAQTDTKTYDGTIDSDEIPLVDDLEFGDSIDVGPTQVFDNENVGTGKTLTASGLLITGGNDNYNISYVDDNDGVINAEEITVIGATTVPKVYDGDTDAEVDFGSISLDGIVGAEVVILDSSGYSATFDTKDIGVGKTVTVTGLVLTGADAGNYSIIPLILTDGEITVKSIDVTAQTDTKVYDGTTDSDEDPIVDSLAAGDSIDTPPIQTFDDSFTVFFEKINNKLCKIITPRTSKYLNWRFFEHPENKYHCYKITQNDHLVGYFVLKKYQNKCHIVDYLTEDNEDFYNGILKQAISFCNHNKLDKLTLWSNKTLDFHKYLQKNGFSEYPMENYFIIKTLSSAEEFKEILNYNNWYMTMSDSDVF
ncbi:MAG: hypothetical protein IIC67_10730, partial [Thaumarchaeota archaeon]|nr:hypothetical protein [Nitrososphaerota archaeon]